MQREVSENILWEAYCNLCRSNTCSNFKQLFTL